MGEWDISQAITSVEIAREGVEQLPQSRERSIAITKLDEAQMWLEKLRG